MKHKPGLHKIDPTFLRGSECFRAAGRELCLEDYWRWSASSLLDNVARGVLAEFIVSEALREYLPKRPRVEWENYDLTPTINGRKVTVEVKSSAEVQAWCQKGYSRLSFRAAATRKSYWNDGWKRRPEPERADLYVFCALRKTDIKSHLDALNLNNWEFCVVLGKELKTKTEVAWSTLRGELNATVCRFDDLECRVVEAANKLD